MIFELPSKMKWPARWSLIALLAVVPMEVSAIPELKAEQQEEIVANVGKEIEVRGTVREVSTVGSGGITFVNFEGVKFGGVSAVIKREDHQLLEKQMGGHPANVLTGRDIILRGRVTLFDGRPQIVVRDKEQIELVGKAAGVAVPRVSMMDSAALRKMAGQEVSIEGIVSRVGSSKNGGVVFMNFEGAPPNGFTAVVMLSQIAAVETSVGGNLDAALPGRKVILTGPISLYRETPQIELKSGDQIKVVR